jgi:hypothetical protein
VKALPARDRGRFFGTFAAERRVEPRIFAVLCPE